jgi:hypothetical protein
MRKEEPEVIKFFSRSWQGFPNQKGCEKSRLPEPLLPEDEAVP